MPSMQSVSMKCVERVASLIRANPDSNEFWLKPRGFDGIYGVTSLLDALDESEKVSIQQAYECIHLPDTGKVQLIVVPDTNNPDILIKHQIMVYGSYLHRTNGPLPRW